MLAGILRYDVTKSRLSSSTLRPTSSPKINPTDRPMIKEITI